MLALKHAQMLVLMAPADYSEKSQLKDVSKIGLFMRSDLQWHNRNFDLHMQILILPSTDYRCHMFINFASNT